jgi:mRNA interferase MazF
VLCERFEIAVVPFPFDDIAVRKRRPVVALSSRRFNEQNGSTIFAMVTTGARTSWPSDVVIEDLAEAGLTHPCVMRLRLITLPNGLIVRKLGRLAQTDASHCIAAIESISQ